MRSLLVFLIRIYQKIPLPSHQMCRFSPTCSEYAIESLQEYGCIKGISLSFKRLMRCHPYGDYGYDPVPKKELQNEKD